MKDAFLFRALSSTSLFNTVPHSLPLPRLPAIGCNEVFGLVFILEICAVHYQVSYYIWIPVPVTYWDYINIILGYPSFNTILIIFCLVTACERLILLEHDPKELRDYAVLLYHCGYYEEALQFLKHYRDTKVMSSQFRKTILSCSQVSDSTLHLVLQQQSGLDNNIEEDAVEKLVVRLNLILMEVGWSKQPEHRNILFNNSEPW